MMPATWADLKEGAQGKFFEPLARKDYEQRSIQERWDDACF